MAGSPKSTTQQEQAKSLRTAPPLPHDEKEFRIRPRRPPPATDTRVSVPPTLGRIYGYARQTARSVSQVKHARRPYRQRCAVRATYVANRTSGQWKAHGKYLSRETATQRGAQRAAGFDQAREKVDVAQCLDDWQQAGDPRLWKIIVSPEFGEQLNMPQLARSVMSGIEGEIGTGVEWVAVAHYNTGHPHVHIAMRGVDRQGRDFRMPREFVQHGIRRIAEDYCTRELGYRSRAQAMEAQRREINEKRYTSLDRIIARANVAGDPGTHFSATYGAGDRAQFAIARLAALEALGLARRVSADSWEVRSDFAGVLRGIQKMADRQKTLNAGGVVRSDERLPILPLDHRALACVEGRILVHGEEENGRSYMMLESTDAKIYAIYHTPQMQEMRSAGGLRVDTFARLRRKFARGRPRIEAEELGTAESILKNRGYLRQTVQQLARKGVTPKEDGWAGWLGRYQQAVSRAADELEREQARAGISR